MTQGRLLWHNSCQEAEVIVGLAIWKEGRRTRQSCNWQRQSRSDVIHRQHRQCLVVFVAWTLFMFCLCSNMIVQWSCACPDPFWFQSGLVCGWCFVKLFMFNRTPSECRAARDSRDLAGNSQPAPTHAFLSHSIAAVQENLTNRMQIAEKVYNVMLICVNCTCK